MNLELKLWLQPVIIEKEKLDRVLYWIFTTTYINFSWSMHLLSTITGPLLNNYIAFLCCISEGSLSS